MNTPSAATPPMGDDDIRAFTRADTPPAAPPPPPRRRRWPWVLLALALLGLAMLLLATGLVWQELQGSHELAGEIGDWQIDIGPHGWHGEPGFGGVVAAVAAVMVALLVVTVVVPLVLLGAGLAVGFALTLAALALVAALGLALGAAALVLLIVTAPLWLIGLLLWWALKPSKPAAPAVASSPSA